MYLYIYVHIFVYMYIYVYTYVQICVWISVCVYTCTHIGGQIILFPSCSFGDFGCLCGYFGELVV